MTRGTATAIGFCAVLLWASLAVLTAASGTMPPFQLLSTTFAIGGLAGVALWIFRPAAARAIRQPWPVYLLGVGGLFGYHAAYFIALRNAPVVEAGLINYLWPLLIVVFSALLPGEKLKWQHIAGCVLAFAGAVLVGVAGHEALGGERLEVLFALTGDGQSGFELADHGAHGGHFGLAALVFG